MRHYESEMMDVPMAGQMVSTNDAEERDSESSRARIIPQLGFASEEFQKTQAMFYQLLDKINPILLPEDSTTVAQKEVSMPPKLPSSELSDAIDDLKGRIIRLQRMISETSERVQL